jgi:hypothetical protein
VSFIFLSPFRYRFSYNISRFIFPLIFLFAASFIKSMDYHRRAALAEEYHPKFNVPAPTELARAWKSQDLNYIIIAGTEIAIINFKKALTIPACSFILLY